MSQGTLAGSVFVEIFSEDSKFRRGLTEAENRLRKFSDRSKQYGSQLMKSSVAIAGVGFLAVRSFAAFEKQMSVVKVLTGATGEQFEKLNSLAKELGETTTFSASQSAEAMSRLAQAGFSVNEIMSAMPSVLNLAAAGELEIAEAANITAQVMRGMDIRSGLLKDVVDVLASASSDANTDIRMLGEGMKFVGSSASAMKLSIVEVMASIQLLSDAGLQAEMAGTGLRGVLLSLASPTAKATDELDKLGVSVIDQKGDVREFVDIVRDFENALSGMGSGDRMRSLGRIFSDRQANAMAAIINRGADDLQEKIDSLSNSSGSASEIATAKLDNISGDATLAISALEGVAIALSETFNEDLRENIQKVTDALGSLTDWIRENERLVNIAVKGVIVIGGLGAMIAAVGVTVQVASWAFGLMTTGIKAVSVATIVFKGIMAATGLLLAAITSPVGIAVAALAAIAAIAYYNSDAFKEAIGIIFKSLGSFGQWVVAWAKPIGKTFSRMYEGIKKAWESGNLEAAGEIALSGLYLAFLQGVKPIRELWIEFVNLILKTWHEMSGKIQSLWEQATKFTARQVVKVIAAVDGSVDTDDAINTLRQEETENLDRINNDAQRKIEATNRQAESDLREAQRSLLQAQLKFNQTLEKVNSTPEKVKNISELSSQVPDFKVNIPEADSLSDSAKNDTKLESMFGDLIKSQDDRNRSIEEVLQSFSMNQRPKVAEGF